MDINQEINTLLKEIGPGKMSSTAYDTAWVARLDDIDADLSNRALEWLCENQLSDGSWGAERPFYYHDRVISTLAVMLTLTRRGRRSQDKVQIEKGLLALERITSGATQGLTADPNGATVGFEMIVPTLVSEAEKLGIIKQQGNKILGRLQALRQAKMNKLAGMKINKYVTAAFSAEMAGRDSKKILDINSLQDENGSIAHSPSATAYLLQYISPENKSALEYLQKWISPDGGVPNVAPFDVFEPAWVLWNLSLIPSFEVTAPAKKHLDFLKASWKPGVGIGHASEYLSKDSDDTSLVYDLLSHFGYEVDIESVLSYEEDHYFRCFDLEANPSISANIHVLGALKRAGYDVQFPSVQKTLSFLKSAQTPEGFWFDKWHASPYYPTSHAILVSSGYDDALIHQAVDWILKTQNSDGSWGFYESSAEETAYALQALIKWYEHGGKLPQGRVEQAYYWLAKKYNQPYEPLWIGKALYCPELVVKSTILSALALAREIGNVN